jgi:hypothetical protein
MNFGDFVMLLHSMLIISLHRNRVSYEINVFMFLIMMEGGERRIVFSRFISFFFAYTICAGISRLWC